MRLEGKVAVVTGAASGIGKATAELFVKEGAKVVGVDLHKEAMDEMAAALGENFVAFGGDISLQETNEGMIDKAIEAFGTVDILINNAGMIDQNKTVGHMDNATWDRVMGVNLTGPMYAIRYFVNKLREAGKTGSIVSTASAGGASHPCCSGAAYAASKAALVQLTRHVAFTYHKERIRCNTICVGGVYTNIGSTFTDPDEEGTANSMPINTLINWIAQPEELAQVMLFLASDESSFVSGAVVEADGAWSCA